MLTRGARLGPYEVVDCLGIGGMGEVYRARDPRLGREVAVKVLGERVSVEAQARFERESRAVAALSHPNIRAIHDVGREGGLPYAVMELLEGQPLRALLEEGPLPRRKALDLGLQVARGLAAAQDRGVVHRDLKPENVFVTRDGQARLLDFGLARFEAGPVGGRGSASDSSGPTQARADTDPGQMMGTVGYMSPEQVRGQPVDHRTDIFSLGALLHEMLTGQRAFQAGTAADTISAILREDPPPLDSGPAGLPPVVDRVVRHCLEKRPEERFQSAHDVAFALQAIIDVGGSGLSGAGLGVPEPRARRWWSRPRLALAASAVALAGLGWLAGSRAARAPLPEVERLTFQRGSISAARFSGDGTTVVHDARWDGGSPELYAVRADAPESRALGLAPAQLLACSRGGELAVLLAPVRWHGVPHGTLARVPLGGGAPRPVREGVQGADWTPAGELVVLGMTEDSLWRLEGPDGRLLYQGPRKAAHLRVSTDGSRAAFFLYQALGTRQGEVVAVPLAGGTVETLTDAADVTGLAWGGDGREVWYSALEGRGATALRAVAPGGGQRTVWRGVGEYQLLDVGRDGRVLLAAHHRLSAVAVQRAGEARERNLALFDASWAQDLSADGSTLLLNEQGAAAGPGGAFYLRPTDGGAAVRLGQGRALALSADRRLVVAGAPGSAADLVLVPTGAGRARRLALPGLAESSDAWFFPGGSELLVAAFSDRGESRYFRVATEGGAPRAVTPPDVANFLGERPLAPDGRSATGNSGTIGAVRAAVFPLDGGPGSPVRGFEQGDALVGWSADGRSVYAFRRDALPAPVFRLDLGSGRRTRVRDLMPADPAGVAGVAAVLLTPDAHTVAYNYERCLSQLYVVAGLR